MKTIAIYNNKGGAGKSTLTLFLADFFSSLSIAGKKARVLIVDVDGQGSSAISLLGLQRVAGARAEKRSLSHLLLNVYKGRDTEFSDYLFVREEGVTGTRQIPLAKLSVMVPERESIIKLEEDFGRKHFKQFEKYLTKAFKENFDLVLLDLPANIDSRNKLSLAALHLSNHIIIPTEPTRLAINALNDTFNTIQNVRGMENSGVRPEILGVVLNKTDRRTQQFKDHNNELKDMVATHNTVVFENFLPTAPTLATATDDSLDFATLKERYSTYYDNVRKVAIELIKKC
ncbi:ATPase [Candidatus Scalindua japonica]|uniref:ATPase n=1 Tax=Candidatus Scalindua japonica TaxID=1284222 RepID=A0A286U2J8_9BACT|nr:ParA family protein [Candidatus Scalindua japonica]GAX62359.1 ATPase [Candidatus Scalindua japonica]